MIKKSIYKLSIIMILTMSVVIVFADSQTYYDSTNQVGLTVDFQGKVPSGLTFTIGQTNQTGPDIPNSTVLKAFSGFFDIDWDVIVQSGVIFIDYEDSDLTDASGNLTESDLQIYQFSEGLWEKLTTTIDLTNNRISTNINPTWIGTIVLIHVPGSGATPIETLTFKNNHQNNLKITSNQLSFTTNNNGHVTCKLLNLQGQEIRTLFNGVVSKGFNIIDIGNKISTGMYLVSFSNNNKVQIKKHCIIR